MARPKIPSYVACHHCGSMETSKAGFSKGKQRFYCRECRRYFRESAQAPAGDTDYRKRAGGQLPSASHLILELRTIAQRLGKTPTTMIITELSKEGKSYSLNTYYAVFGSFLTALKRARLKARYKQEFDETDRMRMLADLRELKKRLKRPIYEVDVIVARRKGRLSSPFHMARAFGSVPEAIKAAGAGDKKYTRQEMIDCLQKLNSKLGRVVEMPDIQREFQAGRGPSYKSILREFGGIGKARVTARVRRK